MIKKILIDLSYTQGNNTVITGIYLYGKQAVKVFLNKPDIEVHVMLLDHCEIDEWILNDENIKKEYLKSRKYSKKYYREISQIISNFDVVFFPYQMIEGKIRTYNNKSKVFMTIHDLTPLLESRTNRINKYEYLYKTGIKRKIKYYIKCIIRLSNIWYLRRKNNLKNNISLCSKIITVSEYQKINISTFFKLEPDYVVNCYSKSGKEFVEKNKKSQLQYKDFYLIVSANRYLKNAHVALLALDKLWSLGIETRKVIVLGNLSDSILGLIKHKEKIIRLGYISDEDLEYLYKNTYCFIFPSLSEGFGLPPLEAMKYGTKVICSNAMSLKELYPKAILFNPYSIDSVIVALKKIESIKKDDMISNYNEVIKKQELFDTLLYNTLINN